MQPAIGVEFRVCFGESDSQDISLLPLTLSTVVSGGAISLDALDATLLLLVIRLRPLPRRQSRSGLR